MTQQALVSRLEGRLFADDGFLCMVVGVDSATNMARVSSQREIFEMPLTEVSSRLATYTHLSLDGLNSERTARRLVENDDGWFFKTREKGLEGPYGTQDEANEAMNQYIIAAQKGRMPDQR